MPFGKRQQALLDVYAKELRAVKPEVNLWWAQLVAAARSQHGTEQATVDALKARWPDGPAVHPRVVAIVRKYYLAFEKLNEALFAEPRGDPEHVTDVTALGPGDGGSEEVRDQPISPGVLLSEGLTSDKNKDLLAIPAKYAYWPIGMDEPEWRSGSPS